MQFFRVYFRVLRLLGSEATLAMVLVAANLGLASAQFAEPILFGRIIDKLATAQTENRAPQWSELAPLLQPRL